MTFRADPATTKIKGNMINSLAPRRSLQFSIPILKLQLRPRQRLFRAIATLVRSSRKMDDEFGFSSGDEAELLSLAQNAEKSEHKRKISDSTSRGLSKRAAREIPTSFPSATKALQENFGLQAFRLKQEQAIARILSGKSAVVVFPTGGGKSLVYQVPALVFAEEDKAAGIRGPGEHGLTLVVSPLIALMKDQVDALVRRGINAAAMDSTKSREEYLHT